MESLKILPNQKISCEIKLIKICESREKRFKELNNPEELHEELSKTIQVKPKKFVDANKNTEPDPAQLDPNPRVLGEGRGHTWDETKLKIDVKIPIPYDFIKDDLAVDLRFAVSHLLLKINAFMLRLLFLIGFQVYVSLVEVDALLKEIFTGKFKRMSQAG